MGRAPGWWCGLAEFSPAATMVSKATLSAPPRRMAVSRAQSANCSSVTPSAIMRQHLVEGGVGDGGGPLHAGDLGRVLDLAQRLDRVRGRDQLGRRSSRSAHDPLAGPGDVVGLQADAGRRRQEVAAAALRWSAMPPMVDLDLGPGAAATCSADWVR